MAAGPACQKALGAGKEGDGAEAETRNLLAEAERRLQIHRSAASLAQIRRVRGQFRLSDEAELALRLLEPERLRELLLHVGRIAGTLLASPDASGLMLSLVSQVDPDVEAMVRRLVDLDADGAGTAATPAATSRTGDESVIAEADARLQAPKDPKVLMAIRSLKADFGLSDEVELALRMLGQEHIEEILAGEAELRAKLTVVEDRSQRMLWLVSQLDPTVHALVRRLVEIDGLGQDPSKKAAAEAKSDEEAVAEAQARLRAHGSPASTAAIQRFTAQCGLGEEVELALRMLDPKKLWQLLAKQQELQRTLASAPDKSGRMLSLLGDLDPGAVALVRRFLQIQARAAA